MQRICGIFSSKDPLGFKPGDLRLLTEAMSIPDAAMQTFVDGKQGFGIAMETPAKQASPAATEGQPLWRKEDDVVVALAGELYDEGLPAGKTSVDQIQLVERRYREDAPLSRGNASLGHAKDSSGGSFPGGIDGSFNLAVWDRGAAQLTLAADLFGSKPLFYYYHAASGYFLFASELKALLAFPGVPRDIDSDSLAVYLRMGFVPPPGTLLREVRKILPFEKLALTANGGLARERYYELPQVERHDPEREFWAPKLAQKVLTALDRTLVDSTAVGAFVSGGVDSLVLLAALHELGTKQVTALTVAYTDNSGSYEIESAAAAAVTAGFRHEAVLVETAALEPALASRVFRSFDEPARTFDRGLTQYFLTARAQELGLETCLSGIMGENVIGDMAWLGRLERMERFNAKMARPALPAQRGEDELLLRLFTDRKTSFSASEVRELSKDGVDGDAALHEVVGNLSAGVGAPSVYETYMNLSVFLASTGAFCLPARSVSGLNGVEEKWAYADRRLLEFMQEVPAVLKGSESREKERSLMKAAFAASPPLLTQEPSRGAFPATPWAASPWFEALVLKQAEKLAESGQLLDAEAARRVLRKHGKRGENRDMKSVWNFFVLQTWYDINVSGVDPFETVDV